MGCHPQSLTKQRSMTSQGTSQEMRECAQSRTQLVSWFIIDDIKKKMARGIPPPIIETKTVGDMTGDVPRAARMNAMQNTLCFVDHHQRHQ